MPQDVTSNFDCLKAERDGCNTLILRRLDSLYSGACDGRARRFEVEYRWHNSPETPLNAVQGNEFTYFGHRDVRGYKTRSLFELFRLF